MTYLDNPIPDSSLPLTNDAIQKLADRLRNSLKASPRRITLDEALLYEAHSSWFVHLVACFSAAGWLGRYLAWKTPRKYRRYCRSLDLEERLKREGQLPN
jgi:hypothetical protein